MSNTKHIIDRELLCVALVRPQQLCQKVNALRIEIAILLFPLLQLGDGDLRHGRGLHLELLWQVSSDRVVSK